jgi:DoxX-like protein
LFLFAGSVKLILPIQATTMPVPLPGPFIRFIGVAEVFGAIGLVLPGALKIRQGLRPLAAVGLVIIMAGATVVTLLGGGALSAMFPLIVGVLAGSVAYCRRGELIVAGFALPSSIERATPPVGEPS